SGSQFYIVQGQPVTAEQLDQLEARKGFHYSKEQRDTYLQTGGTPFLDRDYTVFGMVIKGHEVIDKIAEAQKDSRDRPVQDVRMKITPVN
ncbi:MAG: peptidylprolyl isomerase, partial [Haliscomenobacter sp.]|nr:peptidylprolyl isomerase [Haliscomenobacter sp.]